MNEENHSFGSRSLKVVMNGFGFITSCKSYCGKVEKPTNPVLPPISAIHPTYFGPPSGINQPLAGHGGQSTGISEKLQNMCYETLLLIGNLF